MAWWGTPKRNEPIPQNLLVVRGARHHAENIRSLLIRDVPRPPEITATDIKGAGVTETCLKWDCLATLRPEPTNQYDPHAIEVLVDNRRVGYIARNHAPRLKPYLREGLQLECTVFWNGDPEDGYQFYTVQLFS